MKVRIYHDPAEERAARLVAAFASNISPNNDVWAVGTELHSELFGELLRTWSTWTSGSCGWPIWPLLN